MKEKRDKKIYLILLLLFITIAASCVSIWAIWFRNPDMLIAPDYAPIEEDPNADDIHQDDEQKLEVSNGGGAAGVTYHKDVYIDLSDKSVSMLFQNPYRSTCDMVLQISVKDNIIAQSGRIVPGKELTTIQLSERAFDLLTEGGYEGKFVILMYDPITAEKSMLNAEADININVKN